MRTRKSHPRPVPFAGSLAVALLSTLAVSPAGATTRIDGIQISGNASAATSIRVSDIDDYDLIQERNTFRLQYEHELAKRGKFLDEWELPFVDSLHFFGYYRFVYDAVYDINPGGILENQDGSRGIKFSQIQGKDEIRFENVLREVFFDVNLKDLPLSLRIGRQQISWGEALNFRALDSVNSLDLTWHLFFEAGLFGKVGFDELRQPAWTIKALYDVGSIGPFSNAYVEAWDIPFDFQPAEIRFSDESPWGLPFRNALRAGLEQDLGASIGLPAGALVVQPCFDLTGNSETNAESGADFSEAAETGMCPTPGLRETTRRQGNYDRRDPRDVNQFGARFGASAPLGINFTLNYMYRRHLGTDIPGAGLAKFQSGAVLGNPLGFVQLAPHTTFDRSTQEEHTVAGYVRIPTEFFYPYVHVWGFSANYFEEYTGGVINLEATYTKDLPLFNANAFGNGIKKKGVVLGALGFDKPVWIRSLNRRSTFQTFSQLNFNVIPDHEDIRYGPGLAPGAPEIPIAGDVGIPNSPLIPRAFIDREDLDKLKQFEMLTLIGAVTFYKGGSVIPNVFWISDWGNAPAMAWFLFIDWYYTNNVILRPRVNIFSTFGRDNVNDPFAIGRSGGAGNRSELQFTVTYQF